ncbi:hypothetical protein I4U23_005335 [Adineta vaga]|nr:hypothetical protein I4U23_005335 [Adineta vaga]
MRTVLGPYRTVFSGTELRIVMYPFSKRSVFGGFLGILRVWVLLRYDTVSIRTVFGPYRTVLSGTELRSVICPFSKLSVFGGFLGAIGYDETVCFIRY